MILYEPLELIISARHGWAVLALAAWLGICWGCLAPGSRPGRGQPVSAAHWLVLYASQTGNARRIAEQLAARLGGPGNGVALLALNELQPARLASCPRAILVVSTYGEGEAPDNGAGFWRRAQHTRPDLRQLRYALLALGDRGYSGFCAFGHQLSAWLDAAGAQPLIGLQEVDQMSAPTLRRWHQQLGQMAGRSLTLEDTFRSWTLLERRLLNAHSPGAPAWLIRLQPAQALPTWQAGDLAQVRLAGQLRSYSIASLPQDGVLELIVRQVTQADGSLGRVSGWLCCHARPGDRIELQLLPNPAFHMPEDAAASILIGAGTGLAGLRGLLRQRYQRGQNANWLIFGERCEQRDRWLGEELEPLAEEGLLHLDRCFSCPSEQAEYVQQRLRARADQLRQWVDQGACIHVCGSRSGMGAGIHQALQELLTAQQWAALQHGRYRRDLY